jgi:hypothetical protein
VILGERATTRKQFHISARFLIVLVCIERGPGALQLARKKEMINVLHHESLLSQKDQMFLNPEAFITGLY